MLSGLANLGIFPVLAYLTTQSGNQSQFFNFLFDFYLFLILPIYCLTIFGDLIRDELNSDTLVFLTTRPITRGRLLVLKFVSLMTLVQAAVLLNGLLVLLAGWHRGVSGSLAVAPLFLGTQALAVLAYGALSTLLGLITRRYFVLGVLYGLVVEVGIARIPTNINSLALSRHIKTLLGNSEIFQRLYDWSPKGTAMSLGIMLLATVLFLGVGAALFTYREYLHSEEMQK
jgi:ABC-2 type transport system permease protein